MVWVILLLTLILRVINLNQSLWLDEAISALAVRDYSYIGIIRDFLTGDTHPPLYYLSLKFWIDIFGFSEISMRSLSVLFGVVTVYVVYQIGRKFKNKKFGILTSLFLTTAPLHIYYSQEVRMYALSSLAVSVGVLVFLHLMDNPERKNWILFSLSLLLIGLVDYLPLLIIPVFWRYASLAKKRKIWWKPFLFSHLPLLGFLIIWFPIFYKQTLGSRAALISFPAWGELLGKGNLKELALVWVKFIIGRLPVEQSLTFALLIGIVSIPFLYAFLKAGKEKNKLHFFWLWLGAPISISFLGSFFVPGFSFFRLLFVLPAFYFLVAHGLLSAKLSKAWIAMILVLNLSFSLSYIGNDVRWREDWRSAVSFVEEKVGDEGAVLMAFPEPFASYRWYSKRSQIAFGVVDFGADERDIFSKLEKVTHGKQSLFTFDYLMDVTDPQRAVYQGLGELGYGEKDVKNFRGVGQVRLWEK